MCAFWSCQMFLCDWGTRMRTFSLCSHWLQNTPEYIICYVWTYLLYVQYMSLLVLSSTNIIHFHIEARWVLECIRTVEYQLVQVQVLVLVQFYRHTGNSYLNHLLEVLLLLYWVRSSYSGHVMNTARIPFIFCVDLYGVLVQYSICTIPTTVTNLQLESQKTRHYWTNKQKAWLRNNNRLLWKEYSRLLD
jgi:hypothetical protein